MPREEHLRATLKNFRLIFRSVKKYSQWVEAQCGVSSAQLWAMWELLETPGLRVSGLAQALSIHPSTASNLLDTLEKRALIQRERRGPDQRVVRLYLTATGLGLIGRAPRPAHGVLIDALKNLPGKTLRNLNADLGRLVSLMKVKDEAAALEPFS